jgi:hypothetical protein
MPDLIYGSAFAIVPNDGGDLPQRPRGVYIGGGSGVLVAVLGDGVTVTFSGLVTGSILPISPKRILATGTTATLLVGLL